MIPMYSPMHHDREFLGLMAYCSTARITYINPQPELMIISRSMKALFEQITTSRSIVQRLATQVAIEKNDDDFFGTIVSEAWPSKKLALYQTRIKGRMDNSDIVRRSIDKLLSWWTEHDEPVVGLEAPGPILGQNWGPASPTLNELPDKFLVYYDKIYQPPDWLIEPPPDTPEAGLLAAATESEFYAQGAAMLNIAPEPYAKGCRTFYTANFWGSAPWYGRLQAHYAVAGYLEAMEAGADEQTAAVAGWHQSRTVFSHKQRQYHEIHSN